MSTCRYYRIFSFPRLVGLLWAITVLFISSSLIAQESEDEEKSFTDRVNLPNNHKVERKLDHAVRMVGSGEWATAVQLLQSVLDEQEDYFLRQPDSEGRRVSVRAEANRILAKMPREGVQFYELQYGGAARKLLESGKSDGDPRIFADVALRYRHTDAGLEAATLLGTYHLDRGQVVVAGICFLRLLERAAILKELDSVTLFNAAVAFERAGLESAVRNVWAEVGNRHRQGSLPLPLQRRSLDDLKVMLGSDAGFAEVRSASQWPMFMGSPNRASIARGGAPFLTRRWEFPDPQKELHTYASDSTRDKLATAFSKQKGKGPIISGFHPIVAGDMLVFRSYWGIHSVDPKTGDLNWRSETSGSLEELVAKGPNLGKDARGIELFQSYFNSGAHSLLYANSMLGTLSTDQENVYFVEDAALLPLTVFSRSLRWGGQQNLSSELRRWTKNNMLTAIDLKSGKVAWSNGMARKEEFQSVHEAEFKDTFFLGPPLPLEGKLYLLGEVKGEIRLMCLAPGDGRLLWAQRLCDVDGRIEQEFVRRTQAVSLAYSDGVLICPSHSGVVLGVDLLTRSLLWAYSYQEADQSNMGQNMLPRNRRGRYYYTPIAPSPWFISAPVAIDGRVVFVAPDGQSIHCLNVQDGAPVWTAEQENDVYLAGVFRDKVLLVGRERCRALNLHSTGKPEEVWNIPTGLPSGRGICNGNMYFLPLASGEVWAINIDNGEVNKAKSPIRRRSSGEEEPPTPGNLIFHEGDVISQTPLGVFAYPQLAVKEQEITNLLASNPNDPVGLADRGELRLHQGEYEDAAADLRLALRNEPTEELRPKVSKKLYEALSEMLERDFVGGEKYLKEFQELTTIPPVEGETPPQEAARMSEELRRKANYLRLLASGRESQGRLSDALTAYVDYARLGMDELLPVPGETDLRARPDVWAQGRVTELFRGAQPDQAGDLRRAIAEQWEPIKSAGNLDSLRLFVNLFGSVGEFGSPARFEFARRLIEENHLREAEIQLIHLSRNAGPSLSGRAVEELALLMLKEELISDAAFWYKKLNEDYADVIIRNGKTGAQIHREALTDKRLLPYMVDVVYPMAVTGRIDPKLIRNGNYPAPSSLLLSHADSRLPFYRSHQLVITGSKTARFYDKLAGQEVHRMNLNGLEVRASGGFRPNYLSMGHVVVFSWGHYVYGWDPVGKKALWQYNLLPNLDDPEELGRAGLQLNVNNGQLIATGNQMFFHRVGGPAVITGESVCFSVLGQGLMCVDLFTGRLRWARREVTARTEVFGDEDYIGLVIPKRNGKRVPQSADDVETRLIRTQDGASVESPRFAHAWFARKEIQGRRLLLDDLSSPGPRRLHLYDIHSGTDLWARPISDQAFVVESSVPGVYAVIDRPGILTLLDSETGSVLMETPINPDDLGGGFNDSPRTAQLTADKDSYYLLINTQSSGDGVTIMSPLVHTLSGLTTNGPIYSVARRTGEVRWRLSLDDSCTLITDYLDDCPVMFFAGLQIQQRNVAGGARRRPSHQRRAFIFVVDKRDGSLVYPVGKGDQIPSRRATQFHSLNLDRVKQTIELVSYNSRLVVNLAADLSETTEYSVKDLAPAAVNKPERKKQAPPAEKPASDRAKMPVRRAAPIQLQLQLFQQLQQLGKEMKDARKSLDELKRRKSK